MSMWTIDGEKLSFLECEALEWSMIIDEGTEKFELPTFTVVKYLLENWHKRLQFYDFDKDLIKIIHKDFHAIRAELIEKGVL